MYINRQLRHNCVMDGFAVENLRKQLLREGKTAELLDTYSEKFPSIPDHNTPEFWDEKLIQDSSQHHSETDRNKIIASLIQKGEKILDIGVGKGLVENEINRLGINVDLVGTDFTEENLERLRKKYPHWKFLRSKLENLKFPKNYFDRILLLEVIEHIPPIHTFSLLKIVHKFLKPGGIFILSIPVNEGLEEMYPFNPNAHVRVYSKELIIFELEQSGFKVSSVIELTSFSKFYTIKKLINRFLKIREPNNLIVISKKM